VQNGVKHISVCGIDILTAYRNENKLKSRGYFMLVVGLLALYVLCISGYSEQNTELRKLCMLLHKSFHLSTERDPVPETMCFDHSI